MRIWLVGFAALGLAATYACGVDDSAFGDGLNTVGTGGSSTGGNAGGNATGGDPNCPGVVDPCQLVQQCGCGPDEKCTVDGDEPRCRDDGNVGFGELCSDEDCEAGTICVPQGESPALCKRFCNSDADCMGVGAFCTIDIENDDMVVAKACTMDCDPLAGATSGCPSPETKCIIRRADEAGTIWGTDCVARGSAGQGQPCIQSEDCVAGMVCTTTEICVTLCDGDAMPDTICPSGTTCNAGFDTDIIVGATKYGVCF
jgi:hypothetical protein